MGIHEDIKTKSGPERVAIGAFGALFCTTLLSGLAMTNLKVSAEDATEIKTSSASTVSVTVSSSCTMQKTVSTEHSGTITPTEYTDGIGVTSVSVTCNDPAGYAVYAVGYGNDTWNDNTLTGTSSTISTADRATTTNSHWYMKLYDATGGVTIQNNYGDYKAVPGGSTAGENGYIKVASYGAATGSPTATSFKTTYGVYAAADQVAGDYTGKVKYTLVNPHMSDDKNKPKSKDPTPCDLYDAKYCMQRVASWGSSLESGKPVTAMDDRDGKEYTVAKLADGKVWMTTNLDLAGGTALSSSDTDVTDEYIDEFATAGNLTKDGDTIVLPTSATAGFNNDSNAFVYNSGNASSNCASPGCYSYYSWIATTLGGKTSDGKTDVSNYYNAAASICPKGWRLPTSTTSNGSATASNRWKTGDWYALATAYGANLESNYYVSSATFNNNAGPNTTPNFLLGGYYNAGSFYDGGSDGRYWSATSASSTSAYYVYFNSSVVSSANSNSRRLGFSVRCVFEGQ